ncbi:MAG: hypothetical protein ACLR9W_00475 [Enterobacter hormaechei]
MRLPPAVHIRDTRPAADYYRTSAKGVTIGKGESSLIAGYSDRSKGAEGAAPASPVKNHFPLWIDGSSTQLAQTPGYTVSIHVPSSLRT